MRELIKKRWFKAAVAALLAVILLGGASLLLNGRSTVPADAVAVITQPLRSAVSGVADLFERLYGYMYKYDSLVAENEALRERIEQMEVTVARSASNAEENERLKRLLGFSEEHEDYSYVSCTALTGSGSNWSSTFTTDKGASAGIEVGDCVVSADGILIGTVSELGTTWATVRTVVDAEFCVGAITAETGTTALAEGDFELMQQGLLRLSYLPEDAEIIRGDSVMTSGTNGFAPHGLVIGKIVDADEDAAGLASYAVVEPFASLDDLSQVFVIVDYKSEE